MTTYALTQSLWRQGRAVRSPFVAAIDLTELAAIYRETGSAGITGARYGISRNTALSLLRWMGERVNRLGRRNDE